MMFFLPLSIGLSISFIAWGIYLKFNNPGIIDVFWPINIFIISTTFLLLNHWSMPSTLAFSLCILWALRLSLFLFLTRTAKGLVEKRYSTIVSSWRNKKIGFLIHCLFQGFLSWIISLPFYFIAKQNSVSFLDFFLGLLILLSLAAETHADLTLSRFKSSKQTGVCQKGLWGFSRHPNYFFECLVWFGFSMLGIFNFSSIFSLVSPVALFIIMWFFTIPITEAQSLKNRGDAFKDYQNKVSCFIPWAPTIKGK